MRFGDLVKSKVGGLGRFSSFFSSKQKGKIPMNQPRAANENATSASRHEAVEIVEPALAHLTILVATAEPAISTSMRDLLAAYPLRTIWARGVDQVRSALSRETVDACFCGFWLIDGTYREVVRHLKRQPAEIPVIVVCAPSCPQEYRDYLAALNLRAFPLPPISQDGSGANSASDNFETRSVSSRSAGSRTRSATGPAQSGIGRL